MRIALFMTVLFLGTLIGNAQTKGVVVDGGKGLPLAGVNIYLQKDSVGVGSTDRKGEFRIIRNKMEQGDTLIFSYVGYMPFKCTLHELQNLNYRVTMYEQPQLLHEVVVSGERSPFFLEWTWLASLPKPLYSFGGFLHGGKIYVVAGDETLIKKGDKKYKQGTEVWEYHSHDMYVYDIATDEWTKCAKGLVPRAGHAAHFYKGKAFILGGKRFSTNRQLEYTDATMEVHDLDKDTLYMDPVNPHQGVDFTSFIYNDCLYAMGGAIKEKVFSNKIHMLDLKQGVWYELEDIIPAERCGRMNGILVKDKVYFFGGNHAAPMWTAASYDLRTGKWQQLCDLKDGVSYPGLASDGNNIYIFENRNLQVYNIKTNTMRIYELATLDMEEAGLFYQDNTLYIVGGCTRQGIYVTPLRGVVSVDVSQINQ
ncbi:Kelch repeat-containing protein [Bacteroides sp.]